MPDEPTLRGEPHRKLISLQNGQEIAYWTHRFGVTLEQLRQAVQTVGNDVDSVEEHLRKQGHVIVKKV